MSDAERPFVSHRWIEAREPPKTLMAAGFVVGQEVTWSGIQAFVVALDGEEGRIGVGIRLRDTDPPQEGWLDEEELEIVKHADVGDWLPLWVQPENLKPKRSSNA